MKNAKRIEIITGSHEFRQMVAVMEASGMTGCAMIRKVLEKGDNKFGSWRSLTSGVENLMIVTTSVRIACSNLLRPLTQYGNTLAGHASFQTLPG